MQSTKRASWRGLTTIAALVGLASLAGRATAQYPPAVKDPAKEIGLDQKLNAQVPLDTPFVDEAGKPVRLGQYFGQKPVVMVLIWYKCPGICTMELDSMVAAFRQEKFNIGKDYQAVTISINPAESPQIAAAKKQEVLSIYDRPGAEQGWHFLTGQENSIKRVAAAIGFRYAYDRKNQQYAHPAGILVLTPDGRVSRYLYGVQYRPRDLRLGLVEASSNKIGSAGDQLLLLCYHYDPTTGKYSLAIMNIIRAAAVGTVLILAGFVFFMMRFERRRAATGSLKPAAATTPTDA